MMIGEVVDEVGTSADFIGHAGGDNFIVITSANAAPSIKQRLKERFAEEVQTHYNFIDREQEYMVAQTSNGSVKVPFMTLAVGVVSPAEYGFADIREITEMGAEARRNDTPDNLVN
jgi:GGDEF domain-containing protein